jgi:acetyl-CoA carboxylase alpha subunit
MVKRVKREIVKQVKALEEIEIDALIDQRIEKFCAMGAYAK